jgi:hypothetical protein
VQQSLLAFAFMYCYSCVRPLGGAAARDGDCMLLLHMCRASLSMLAWLARYADAVCVGLAVLLQPRAMPLAKESVQVLSIG